MSDSSIGAGRRPPPWDPRLPRRVGLGAALVVVVATLAVLFGSPAPAQHALTPAGAQPAPAVPAASSQGSTPAGPSGPVTANNGDATASASASRLPTTITSAPPTTSRTSDSATIAPGLLHIPTAGSYGTRTNVDGTSTIGTLRVRAGSTPAQEVLETDLGGQTSQEVRGYAFGGAATVASSTAGTPLCAWSSPIVVVPAGLAKGRQWHSDAQCDEQVDGLAVHQERAVDAQVIGTARTTLQGRTFDTWIIERSETDTVQSGGVTYVSQTTSSELFSPALGIAVYTISRTAAPNADGTSTTIARSVEVTSLPAGAA